MKVSHSGGDVGVLTFTTAYRRARYMECMSECAEDSINQVVDSIKDTTEYAANGEVT